MAHEAESMLNLARDGKLVLSGDAFEVALASVDGLKRQIGFAESWLGTQDKLGIDEQLPALLGAIDAVAIGTKPAELPLRATIEEPASANVAPMGRSELPASKRSSTLVTESIKVDRDRLEKLINVIGELVIGQAMVEEEVAVWQSQIGHESLAYSHLNKTVRNLQELSLSLRMVPVGSVFHKMARIVRGLSRKLTKEVRFEAEGEETELDKNVVDQIGDPLLHMVRNAADHGIELPEDRVAAGKPPQGRITLRAFHQGGNIYIEIEHDGKGLDRDVLLRKAIERGIVDEDEKLSDQNIYNLIFALGFFTAQQVTDVFGRGVGMDVVRRNVEALQGSGSVTSQKGKGSTVVIRLPLNLASLDGLSIRVGNEIYIVPILSVVESFSREPNDLKRIAAKGEVVPKLVDTTKRKAIVAGEVFASNERMEISTLLGSCIAVCLYDPQVKAGGMNHFLLPTGSGENAETACYGINAMELLINELMILGDDRERMVARIYGGAHVVGDQLSTSRVGAKNTDFVRKYLTDEGIPILDETLGGGRALRVRVIADTGKVTATELAP